MIQLKLTLGNTFWENFYLPYSEEYGDIMPKISKHKVVFSKKIIDYYEACAEKIGMRDVCSTYIQNYIQSSKKCELADDFNRENIVEELCAIASHYPMKILLAEKNEIKKTPKGIKLLTSKDILENNECVLNLYTIPVTARYVPSKVAISRYKKWLENWMKEENNIIIRDKYLLDETGLQAFKKHYLPMFVKGANITIQTDKDVPQTVLDEFDKVEYSDYKISVYKCKTMHERVFIFKDFQIVIGKGINFMSGDWDLTAESFITISNITIDASSTIIKRLR